MHSLAGFIEKKQRQKSTKPAPERGFVLEFLSGCRWPLRNEFSSVRDAEGIPLLGAVRATFLRNGGAIPAKISSEKGEKLKISTFPIALSDLRFTLWPLYQEANSERFSATVWKTKSTAKRVRGRLGTLSIFHSTERP